MEMETLEQCIYHEHVRSASHRAQSTPRSRPLKHNPRLSSGRASSAHNAVPDPVPGFGIKLPDPPLSRRLRANADLAQELAEALVGSRHVAVDLGYQVRPGPRGHKCTRDLLQRVQETLSANPDVGAVQSGFQECRGLQEGARGRDELRVPRVRVPHGDVVVIEGHVDLSAGDPRRAQVSSFAGLLFEFRSVDRDVSSIVCTVYEIFPM